MKPMTNNRALLSGLNKGYIDEVAKDLNRYQTIERDSEWVCVDGAAMRKKSFLVKHSKGMARWHVEQRNGDVKGVGVIHECDVNAPYRTA
jgi:hypothetical protein